MPFGYWVTRAFQEQDLGAPPEVFEMGLKIIIEPTFPKGGLKGASFIYLFFFHVHWCFACMHVCLGEGFRSPGVRATDSCELPRGCWEWYPGPLQEQPVPLTTEPPFRHAACLLFLRLALYVLEAGVGLSILLPQVSS